MAKELNKIDMAIDFRDLKKAVDRVLSELDHTNLNDHPRFRERNPSSERLAEYIYGRIKEEIGSFGDVDLARVTVCETSRTGVTYWEE